jgi:hypothetical protein
MPPTPSSISIEKAREILGDYSSSDERIRDIIIYLEVLCSNIIDNELREYYKKIGLN